MMYGAFALLCMVLVVYGSPSGDCSPLVGRIEKLERKNVLLSRQVMMQQLFNEERIRSDGNSGVKMKRHRNEGTRPYFSDSYTGLQFINIHDHANYRMTVGMGEFGAVLNGVEFRTRHNDYSLYRPSTTSNEYHAVEEIEFPDVPPEVLAKETLEEQVKEMRLWFKAFKDLDKTERDYTKYFKPVLCYLEGAWTLTDPETKIEEPFVSERHKISAVDWNELHRKIRFTSYSGSKDNGENLAFLPETVIDMVNDTYPIFAQWNYRIMCHPLNKYLETDRLRVVDDIHARMSLKRTLETHSLSRSARFQLNSENTGKFTEGHTHYTLIDKLMYEIPGKDNYRRSLKDEVFGATAKLYYNPKKVLNSARYHRWYHNEKAGANGRQSLHRSFSDTNVFMAMNTQPNIAEQTVNDECRRNKLDVKRCAKTYKQRWSYAIPLEIIYLTPLCKWNPHDIAYEVNKAMGKRNGGMTKERAYDGNNKKIFYRTPSEFYKSTKGKYGDAADTSGKSVGVINKKGDVVSVMASGVHITLPEIEDVGVIRTRYPIAPVHQEGEALWKEVQALRDLILLQEERYQKIREEFGLVTNLNTPASGLDGHEIILKMQFAPPYPKYGITAHTHTFTLSAAEQKKLKKGRKVKVSTSLASAHSHHLVIKYDKSAKSPYTVVKCDGETVCFDNHGDELEIVEN